MNLDDVCVVRLINTDDNPEETYQCWKCLKKDLNTTIKEINDTYDICNEDRLDDLLDEVSIGGYINCETFGCTDFGGTCWAIEVL